MRTIRWWVVSPTAAPRGRGRAEEWGHGLTTTPPLEKKKGNHRHARGRVLKFCIANVFLAPRKCASLSSRAHHDTICLAHPKKLRAAHKVHAAVAVDPVLLAAAVVARLIVAYVLRPTLTTTREGRQGSEDQDQRPDADEKGVKPLRSRADDG